MNRFWVSSQSRYARRIFLNHLDRIDASMFVIRPKQPFQGKKGRLRVITDYQLAIMGDRLFDTLVTELGTNDGERIEFDFVPERIANSATKQAPQNAVGIGGIHSGREAIGQMAFSSVVRLSHCSARHQYPPALV